MPLLPSGSLLTGQSLLYITDLSIFISLYKLFSFSHLSASTTIGFLTTNKFLVLVDVFDCAVLAQALFVLVLAQALSGPLLVLVV